MSIGSRNLITEINISIREIRYCNKILGEYNVIKMMTGMDLLRKVLEAVSYETSDRSQHTTP